MITHELKLLFTECFFNWRLVVFNKLEQLELGLRNKQENLENLGSLEKIFG